MNCFLGTIIMHSPETPLCKKSSIPATKHSPFGGVVRWAQNYDHSSLVLKHVHWHAICIRSIRCTHQCKLLILVMHTYLKISNCVTKASCCINRKISVIVVDFEVHIVICNSNKLAPQLYRGDHL